MKQSETMDEKERKSRKEILNEIDDLLSYCEGCFLFQYYKKKKGRRYAHRFCIRQCTVGLKIQETGRKYLT